MCQVCRKHYEQRHWTGIRPGWGERRVMDSFGIQTLSRCLRSGRCIKVGSGGGERTLNPRQGNLD